MSQIHNEDVRRAGAAIIVSFLLLAACVVRADSLTVANATLVPASATESIIQFDIGWNNSWRATQTADGASYENRDAAWVFIKYHPIKGDNAPWLHATLAKDGHQAPAGATIAVGTSEANGAAFGAGVFIYRSAAGASGPNDWKGLKLRWTHESGAVNTNTVIEVQAIEMVYVPQGAFWAGDGLTNRCRFTKTQITQADPTKDGGRPVNTVAPEGNPLWPNGFKGFYCMKYEISHRDYLVFTKSVGSLAFDYKPYPDRKELLDPPDVFAPRPWLSWNDGAAFSAWAGLRPMTELEYEKACRGPLAPVAGEYAWGTTNRLQAAVGGVSTGAGREQTGASYWGILNLSGGLWDRVVTIDNAAEHPVDKGRQFRGTHGAGTPALPADWPGKDGNGSGFRGGAAGLASAHMGVSDRYSAAYGNNSRGARNGFRAVRSAP